MFPISPVTTPEVEIRLPDEALAGPLFRLVARNAAYLAEYLPKVVEMIDSEAAALAHLRHCADPATQQELLEFHLLHQGELCGALRLNNFEPENHKASLAYFVGAEFQGRGLVGQACRLVLDYAFTVLNLNRVELRCVTTNTGSIRVAERLGFVREGELRQAEKLAPGFVNHYVYSLLREEHTGYVASQQAAVPLASNRG